MSGKTWCLQVDPSLPADASITLSAGEGVEVQVFLASGLYGDGPLELSAPSMGSVTLNVADVAGKTVIFQCAKAKAGEVEVGATVTVNLP